jgi:hypothetical protein
MKKYSLWYEFYNTVFQTKQILCITSVSVPHSPPAPPPIKNSGCTLIAGWTFNYIILSMFKVILHFVQHPSSIHECYNITEIEAYFHLQRQMCNTVHTVLHIYMKELQQELFHTSAPKDGNRTHFWVVIFMQWIRIFNEDQKNNCNHHIISSSNNLKCCRYYQYFSLIQCIRIY